jgi:hypothetical protein
MDEQLDALPRALSHALVRGLPTQLARADELVLPASL